jgi:hypothetical protein
MPLMPIRKRQGRYRPAPLIPEPVSILHDFQTIRPSFDALFDRVLRNFTGIEVPKGERIEDLNIEVVLSPLEAARGVVAPIGVPVSAQVLFAAVQVEIGFCFVWLAQDRDD